MSDSKPNELVNNISYSSIETQRKIRIEKVEKLRSLNVDPYPVVSKRDFKLGFIKFWFDFVHKFDLNKVLEDDESLYSLDYFLHQIVFPRSLLETMEDKLQLRHTVRQMGLDPDETTEHFEDEFEPEIIEEARSLFPNLIKHSEEDRISLVREFLIYKGNDEDLEDEDEEDLDTDESVFEITLKPNQNVSLAGRIKSKRVSGKIAFATVEDESCPEGFQFIFKADDLTQENKKTSLNFDDFKGLIDEGDYIEATGKLDYSQRGEPSLFVESFKILTKSLRPLPDKLDYQNLEERYLNRVADYKMNTIDENGLSVRDVVRLKSKYWQIWREEMIKEGFLEVECPVFEHIPGGADAKPFTTFYNELDQEMYLRISLELPLKKLIAGGFEKVFEIGRIFRNEGSSPQHLQEYTQIEWYWAYTDYNDAMIFTSKVYRRLAEEIIGGLIQIDYYGNQINWGAWCSEIEANKNGWKLVNGWPAIKYYDAIRYFSKGKVDLENKNFEELLKIAKENKIEIDKGIGVANLIDKIFKKVARPYIINPIFLYHYPVELEPLAKRDPENPKLTQRWQIVAGTAEHGKAFSELNDPLDQLARFEDQQKARDAGDEEAQFMNKEYVEAMEYGMPPLSGFGISERLLSFFLAKNIKEAVTFPHIRSIENHEEKSKKTLVAHAVILNTPEIPMWSKMNAAAHLSAAFASRAGKKLIWIDKTETKDGEQIPMNIQHAIIMKQTESEEKILELKHKAEKLGLEISVFTKEMRDSSNDAKVKEWQEGKTSKEIGWLGVLVFGEKKEIEKLTEEFGLME